MNHDGGEAAIAATTVIVTWPKGSFAENLAIDETGMIFVSLHSDRAVVQVDPATSVADRFAVLPAPVAGLVFGADAALYASGGELGQTPGLIWRLSPDGRASQVAELRDARFLNGMTLHPDGRLLVAESITGTIYAVDPASGAFEAWLSDPALTPLESDPTTPGANGIKLHGGFAYVTVTGRDRVLRAPLGADGRPGALDVFAERLRGDDFAFGADGALFIATHPACSLVRLAPDGTRTTLADAAHGMTGATAVAFGRRDADRRSVYVTTTGGTMTLPDTDLEPAKLVRVDVGVAAASAEDRTREPSP